MERIPARLHLGLREKLFLLLAIPILLAMAAITFLATDALTNAINQQYRDKAKAIVDGFNADIVSLEISTSHLQSEIEAYTEFDAAVFEIAIYAPDRTGANIVRIASTNRQDIGTGAASEDLEPFLTKQSFWFESTRDGTPYVEVLAPMFHQGFPEPVAVIGVYMNLTQREAAIRTQRLAFMGITTLVTLLLLSLLYWSLSRLILKPVNRLAGATERVTRGDYDAKVAVGSTDELGELARSVNKMTSALGKQKRELDDQLTELEQVNVKLEETNRTKSEFLAMVSGELRTPLNSVIGFSELLVDNVFGSLNEKQMRYASNIHSSGKHLLRLVNDILDISRVDSGKLELNLEDLSVSTAMEDIESTARPLAAKKRLSLGVRIGTDVSVITADASRFKQIMFNLVANAIRFTPEGGSVTVSAKRVADHLWVSVSDTGIGIAKEDQERVFGEFQRIDTASAHQYEGTGLDLALTKRMVEMHGGRIWVESELGEGSTFTFVIPVHPTVEQATPLPTVDDRRLSISFSEQQPVSQGGQPLILLVAGDRGTSDLFSGWLTDAGYRVARAFDGEQAIRLAYELEPFAIALDPMLPNKDGWQVLQDLKHLPDTRDIPVVIISALKVGNKGFSLGAVDYFTKPIDRDRLLDRLAKLGFSARARQKPLSVLVVDDRPEAVELLTEILRPQGAQIIKAYGGRQAINFALEHLPDLILLDLIMPDFNGFAVVNELRKHPLARRIPIIVVTGKNLSAEEIRKLQGDVESIVHRHSFAREELLAEIAKLEAIYPEKARLINPASGLLTPAGFRHHLLHTIATATRYNTPVTIVHVRTTPLAEGRDSDLLADSSSDLARLLRAALKPDELGADLGDGQFAVILPHIEKSVGAIRADEILRAWANYRPAREGHSKPVKIATTVAVVAHPIDAEGAEQLIARAQEYLEGQSQRDLKGAAPR